MVPVSLPAVDACSSGWLLRRRRSRCSPFPIPDSTTPPPIRDIRPASTATPGTTRSRSTSRRRRAGGQRVGRRGQRERRLHRPRCPGRPARLAWGATAAEWPTRRHRTLEYRLATPPLRGSSWDGSCSARCGWSATSSYGKATRAILRAAFQWRRSLCWWPTSPGCRRRSSAPPGAPPRRQCRGAPARLSRRSPAPGGQLGRMRIERPSLDGRNLLTLELRVDPRRRRPRERARP